MSLRLRFPPSVDLQVWGQFYSDLLAALAGGGGVGGLTAHPGGGQANATQVALGINVAAQSGTKFDSFKLPPAVIGSAVVIFVGTEIASPASLFPAVGEEIGSHGTDTAIDLGNERIFVFTCTATGVWQGSYYQSSGTI